MEETLLLIVYLHLEVVRDHQHQEVLAVVQVTKELVELEIKVAILQDQKEQMEVLQEGVVTLELEEEAVALLGLSEAEVDLVLVQEEEDQEEVELL
jgi:hypothetical protein